MKPKLKNILTIMFSVYLFCSIVLPNQIKVFNKASISDVTLLLIVVIYIIFELALKKTGIFSFFTNIISYCKRRTVLLMFILCVIMFSSTFYAFNKSIAISESIRFFSYILAGYIIVNEITAEHFKKYVIPSFTLSSVVVNMLGLYQYFTKIGVKVNLDINGNISRIESTFGNPNAFGAYLVITIFPLIMLFLLSKTLIKKFFYFSICTLTLLNLVLTLSRNSWLSFALGIIVLIFTFNWRFIYLAVVGLVGVLLIPHINSRVKQFADVSQNQGRINIWNIAIKMFNDHPLRGVGNGNFSALYNKYVELYPQYWVKYASNFPTHNSYLKMLSELGIIGLTSFLFVLVNACSVLLKCSKHHDKYISYLFKGFVVSFFCMIILNCFDNILFVPQVAVVFWTFMFAGEAFKHAA